MKIDPRLNEIDDCLYRVALRALVVDDGRVLVVREVGDDWWAIPGGGIDHGETIERCLRRELKEEIGVSSEFINTDYQIAHYSIGKVVNSIPRMNIFFKVVVPKNRVRKTSDVQEWMWCTNNEFLKLEMNPSYNRIELASVIFGE